MSTCPPPKVAQYRPFCTDFDNFFGIALARQHISVGHARHGDVLVAFAPSAAGGSGFHQAARQLVLQIATQHAIFDQHVFLRGHPFVVHVERSAPAADGAVVDHRAKRARHLLADAPAEGRHALAIEVRFEAVAHRFVQQNPRPAGPQHHRRFAGRRVHRIQLHDGLARGFASEMFRRLFVQEEIQRDASAAARSSHAAERHRPSRASALTLIRAIGWRSKLSASFARCHQNLRSVGIARLHLENARIICASRDVGALYQGDALGEARFHGARAASDKDYAAALPRIRS